MKKTTKTEISLDYRLAVLVFLLVAGTFALFQLPKSFGNAERETDEIRANRERIANMTQPQRDRVKIRAGRFDAMTEDQRDRVRKLHGELQNDPDGEDLRAVLKKYNDWMASLTYPQRTKLRNQLAETKDVEQRRSLIAKKIEDERFLKPFPPTLRDRLRDQLENASPERRDELKARFTEFRYGSRSSRRPVLEGTELETVVELISGRLEWTPQQQAELKALRPFGRRLRIMTTAINMQKKHDGQGAGPFSDNALRDAVERDIENAELKKKLLDDSKAPRFRRSPFRILFLVSRSLSRERAAIVGDPTDAQLFEFFEKLSATDQEKIMLSAGSDQIRRLKKSYHERGGEDGDEFRNFRRFMGEWMFGMFGRRGKRPAGLKP